MQQLARYWWVELLLGVFWVVVALVVLKFNHASVVTVGVLTGIMFLVFAAEEFLLAALDKGASRWVWAIFGVLLECPRGRGHLIAWVCPTRLEGCGVHAKDASAVSRGVPS